MSLNTKFIIRRGYFGQRYWSLRLKNQEITIDNLWDTEKYRVCICSPYSDGLDKKNHHNGYGGGEVKKEWEFENKDEAFKFVCGLVI